MWCWTSPPGFPARKGPGRPAEHWDTPDAFVGVVHRLDTGVSGLMVFARTPAAAAALSRQITQSQEAYAVQDGRAEGRAEAPCFVKQYRAVLSGGPNDALPAAGTCGTGCSRTAAEAGCSRSAARARACGKPCWNTALSGRRRMPALLRSPCTPAALIQIRVQFASRKHPLWGDGKYGSRVKGTIALQSCGLQFVHPDTGRIMNFTLPLPDTAPWNLFAE